MIADSLKVGSNYHKIMCNILLNNFDLFLTLCLFTFNYKNIYREFN